MAELALSLDRADTRPLGAQLAEQIRDRITGGHLVVGDRMPSTRALAGDLGVARAITEQAYGQLVAEGWLEGRRGSGTFVAAEAGSARAARRRRPATGPVDAELVRLDTGTPWVDARYASLWRRAWRDVSAARPPAGYHDARGLPGLREELAARLSRIRGLDCDPDEVLVTAGTSDGLRHLLGALPPGPVGIEDPGYRAAVMTTRLAGRGVVDVPALSVPDTDGLAALYVTPAHQHPLGPTMPGSRRLDLLARARLSDTVIVEDDYDSEFRYDVAPVPALAALDRNRVAYLGSASKGVAPSMRLGWLVPPPQLLDRLNRTRSTTHDSAAWPVQRAFLSLLRDGYVDKVIRSARRAYVERAARVITALGPHGASLGPVAGMYATFEMPAARAHRARAAARAAGFDVPLLADYCRSAQRHGLIVGFGGCTDEQLDAALRAIRSALEQ